MVVCAHLQRVYHWMVTTQTTFCGRKRRLRTEPGSTALTVAGVGFCKGGCIPASRVSLRCNPLCKILNPLLFPSSETVICTPARCFTAPADAVFCQRDAVIR